MLKERRLVRRLSVNVGLSILVRWYLYIETGPWIIRQLELLISRLRVLTIFVQIVLVHVWPELVVFYVLFDGFLVDLAHFHLLVRTQKGADHFPRGCGRNMSGLLLNFKSRLLITF